MGSPLHDSNITNNELNAIYKVLQEVGDTVGCSIFVQDAYIDSNNSTINCELSVNKGERHRIFNINMPLGKYEPSMKTLITIFEAF